MFFNSFVSVLSLMTLQMGLSESVKIRTSTKREERTLRQKGSDENSKFFLKNKIK